MFQELFSFSSIPFTISGAHQPSNSQDLIHNSPYCLSYSSCDVSFENLVLGQLIIPQLKFLFILITCLLDTVLIL